MNIKDTTCLVKHIINCIVIVITHYYQIAMGNTSYLITTNTGNTFSVS